MNIKSEMLVESKSLRETVINRVDVLDKVKKLSMLPGDLYITLEMAAKYYEVEKKTVDKAIQRNRSEFMENEIRVVKGKELADMMSETEFTKLPPTLTVINRRALLRIGMLLQDSEVAKAVRSYLLDREEEKKSVPTTDVSGLTPELQMFHHLFQGIANTQQKQVELEQQMVEDRKETSQVKAEIEVIKETILTHDKNWRKSINGMMNAAVYRLGTNHADLRNKSYEMLEDRGHCNLKLRLERWHGRLEKQGHSKSKIDEVKRIDVIENDVKLKEIYTIIVKEISISSLKLVGGK